jgi:hypothetical protein
LSKKIMKVYIVLFLIANFIFLLYLINDSTMNNNVPHDSTNSPFDLVSPPQWERGH